MTTGNRSLLSDEKKLSEKFSGVFYSGWTKQVARWINSSYILMQLTQNQTPDPHIWIYFATLPMWAHFIWKVCYFCLSTERSELSPPAGLCLSEESLAMSCRDHLIVLPLHHLLSSFFPQLNLKLKSLNFVSKLTHGFKVSFFSEYFLLKTIKLRLFCFF